MNERQDSFFIPSSYSRIVARELGLHERDLPGLLNGTGLPIGILLPGDETRITGTQQLQVLVNARQIGKSPEFGLRLGRQLQPSTHGPLGYLALSSPDLLTGLKALRDFLPIRIPIAYLQLDEDSQWLNCRLQLKLQAGPSEQQMLLECFSLVVQSMVERFLGRELIEAELDVEYDQPHYHHLYPQYLHGKVRFNQPESVMRIPRELALMSNTSDDPQSFALAMNLCQELLTQLPAATLTMKERVRRFLLSQPPGSVSEDDVARAMFISKRTLARRLAQEASGFRQIRKDVLSQMASRHLRDSSLTVESIGALLGYHDTANFRRAFKRWYGVAPAEFRRQVSA